MRQEARPETTGVRIIITRKAARIAGVVVDRNSSPTADGTVIVFSSDAAQWGTGSRFVKAGRPGSDGRFSIGGLPPGTYHAIAREYVPDGEWEDPEVLRTLARDAAKYDVAESETIELTLTVNSQP